MDPSVDWTRVFQTVTLGAFVVLMLLAASRMMWRWTEFKRHGMKSPYLLRRDLILFGTFTAYFGFVLFFRVIGFQLSGNPFWVVPTTLAGLFAMGYWVWVEFHLDD